MKDLAIRSTAAVQAWAVTLKNRTEGATAAEYALLVALIAVAIIVAVRALGTSISGVFTRTGNTLNSANT
ncbi:MAG: Flp family type IVb pilin [Acidimicrobiales bacterium]